MIERHGFWILALLWLPAGIAAAAAVRLPAGGEAAAEPGAWFAMAAHTVFSLAVVAPCGLPLALGCRRLWRLGYRQGAWWAGIGARGDYGGGVGVRRTAGAGCDRYLRSGAEPSHLGGLVLALPARLSGTGPADGGPAAQQEGSGEESVPAGVAGSATAAGRAAPGGQDPSPSRRCQVRVRTSSFRPLA